MNTGTYISGIGHAILIGWVLLGGLFSAPPPAPLEVSEVSIVTGEEFAALTAPASAPAAVDEAPAPNPVPPVSEPAPAPAPEPDTAPETPAVPAPTTPAEPDAAPDVSRIEPLPDAEVTDAAPTPPTPPAVDEGTMIVTEPSRPQPAPRVAPTPAAPPAPDAAVSEDVAVATTPGETSDTTVPEAEATAPEEATTEIVTEAEETETAALAPARSMRPKTRPARTVAAAPEPPATPASEPPAPETAPATPDAIDDALAEALDGGSTQTTGSGSAAVGPPMTGGEKDALRVAVGKCWNVGSLSTDALRTSVVVAVSMNEDGTPRTDTIKLVSFDGGTDASAKQTYESARRAIIRCGATGYDLPVDKYAQWRDIEMTFNPEKMRIK